MPDREKVISEFERWCDEMEDECPVICLDALALLKEQDDLLRKLQKDKDKLCLEVSEWKHKFHDRPLKEQESKQYNSHEVACIYHHYCIKCGWDWWTDEASPNRCSRCGYELT